jgi:monothiol glutaredoxin
MLGFGGSGVYNRRSLSSFPGVFQARLAGVFMDILDVIKDQIASNTIILYMKGSPNQPQCGFSARASQALMACGERFAYVDILSNPEIRTELPKYANWPTFPQLWVGGELVGGCDIVCEMYESGELQKLIKDAVAAKGDAPAQ